MKFVRQKLRNWYYNTSINTKLNLTNLVISIIPMILLAFVSSKASSDIIISKSAESSLKELDVVRRSLDNLLSQAEYLSKLTAVNAEVQHVIGLRSNQLPLFLERRIAGGGALDDIVGGKTTISGATIMTSEGFLLTSGNIDTAQLGQLQRELTALHHTGVLGKGEVVYRSTQPTPYYAYGDQTDSLAAYRYVLSTSGEIRGVLRIDIDERTIANLLPAMSDEAGEIFVVDERGRVIVAQNNARLYQTIQHADYFQCLLTNNLGKNTFCPGGNDVLATSLYYDRAGWYIVRLIPATYLTEDSNRVTALILLAVLICVSLALGTAVLHSRAIARPIIRLAKEMGHAGMGDMEVRFEAKGNDEIGMLGRSFNSMMEQISELMERVYVEQRRKREFEFMALQAQINPHFLYNTLESVCALALKNNRNDVITMVKSLALFYRSILSQGRTVISIREEIENVRHYLSIQKIRYDDKFDYAFVIDPGINDSSIIKLILQPLVENALYHGIKQKQGKGTITITGSASGDAIKISVIDDGVGFAAAGLPLGAPQPKPGASGSHYGLSNVDERIKLYFGPAFGLTIQSEPGIGTRVDVLLPAQVYRPQALLVGEGDE
jgi:two-component system, sensor histidine kinase YesM